MPSGDHVVHKPSVLLLDYGKSEVIHLDGKRPLLRCGRPPILSDAKLHSRRLLVTADGIAVGCWGGQSGEDLARFSTVRILRRSRDNWKISERFENGSA